jgi:hypothetical protein
VLREVALKNTGESRGQYRGIQDYGSFFLGTMRYSLRRALLLDSVDGCTRNLTILKIPCRSLARPVMVRIIARVRWPFTRSRLFRIAHVI